MTRKLYKLRKFLHSAKYCAFNYLLWWSSKLGKYRLIIGPHKKDQDWVVQQEKDSWKTKHKAELYSKIWSQPRRFILHIHTVNYSSVFHGPEIVKLQLNSSQWSWTKKKGMHWKLSTVILFIYMFQSINL